MLAAGQLPTRNEKGALAGTNGTPSSADRYVTDTDPRVTNAGAYQGTFSYAASAPSAAEMAAALTAVNQFAHFKKGNTDTVYHVFRRSTAAGGLAADFAYVALT